MKIICGSAELCDALKVVSRAVPSRSTLPVIGNALLIAEGEMLQIACTDLEVGIRTSIPANIKEGGMITVPAKQLLELVATLPDDRISISAVETERGDKSAYDYATHQVHIQCRRAKYRLAGLDANQMPWLPKKEPLAQFHVPQELLRSMIGVVLPCLATNDNRPHTCCAIMKAGGNQMMLAGTDTIRLAIYDSVIDAFDSSEAYSGHALLTRRTLQEIQHLAVGIPDAITRVLVDDAHVNFEFQSPRLGNVHLVARQMECNYPDVRRMINQTSPLVIAVDRQELAQLLKRITIVARDNANQLNLTLRSDILQIDAISIASEAHEEIGIEIVNSSTLMELPTQFGFNCSYLVDLCAAFSGEQLLLHIEDPEKPIIFRSSDNQDYLSLAMPLVFKDAADDPYEEE